MQLGIMRALRRASIEIRSLGARVNRSPVIILGNQKSGTTAIAALLAEMTGHSVSLDLKKEMRRPVIQRLRSGGISMADLVKRNRLDFSRDIIKEPGLSPFYSELVEHFPDARFVMIVRDPRDNIRSILNRLGVSGNLARLDDNRLAGMTRGWRLIVDGSWLGLEGADHIEMLARRWNLIADIYLDHADEMTGLTYEAFLSDKAGELERLARALGLAPLHDVTHRLDVQFQPAGDSSVRWDEFFGAENLARIEGICADRMRRLGYPVD